jgi:O-antigen/teichoic acid export membrane protein
MMLAQGGRVITQAIYFVVIARTLGISEFGALAAAIALVSILVPYAAWGSGNLLVMGVSRDPSSFSRHFGNALLFIGGSCFVLVPLAVGAAALFIPQVPAEAVLFFAVADLCFARVADIGSMAFQALDEFGWMAALSLLAPSVRCVAAIIFAVAATSHSLVVWASLYLVGSAVAGLTAYVIVWRRLGPPRAQPRLIPGELKIGGYFAVSLSASSIYGDIDKTMLARLGTLSATGVYAAADRAVGMAFLPIGALLAAAYARFFRAGVGGMRGSVAYAWRLTPIAVGYGAVAGVVIYVLAPLAPHILGSDFEDSVAALRWLAPIPVLSALYYLPADALTGANGQGIRTLLQLIAAGLNVGLNLLLIPDHSWRGAAWSTLISLAFLAVSLWTAALLLRRSADRAVIVATAASR